MFNILVIALSILVPSAMTVAPACLNDSPPCNTVSISTIAEGMAVRPSMCSEIHLHQLSPSVSPVVTSGNDIIIATTYYVSCYTSNYKLKWQVYTGLHPIGEIAIDRNDNIAGIGRYFPPSIADQSPVTFSKPFVLYEIAADGILTTWKIAGEGITAYPIYYESLGLVAAIENVGLFVNGMIIDDRSLYSSSNLRDFIAICDDTILVTDLDTLYSLQLDSSTVTLNWTYNFQEDETNIMSHRSCTTSRHSTNDSVYCNPIYDIVFEPDNPVYISYYPDIVCALDQESGDVQWRKDIAGKGNMMIDEHDHLLVLDQDGILHSISANGDVNFSKALQFTHSPYEYGSIIYSTSIQSADSGLILVHINDRIYCLSNTGENAWSWTFPVMISTAPTIDQMGRIHIPCVNDVVYVLK